MAGPPPAPAGSVRPPPFFVIGSDRSGTTLLRLYLCAHSTLAIPSESWFLIDLFAAFDPAVPLAAADLRRAVTLVTDHPRFRDGWHVDPAALLGSLERQGGVTLADLIDTLFRLETGVAQGARWGDKTPEYALHVADLDRCFPAAQFVHIVRDGRDVYLSLARRRWSDRGHTPYELGRYWSQVVAAAGAAGTWLGPARYLSVTYEELVLETRATLERVTSFLGVPFEEGMLDAHRDAARVVTASERSAGVHDKLSRSPRAADVARWRAQARGAGVRLAAGTMGRQLRAYAYPDPPSPVEALVTRNLAAYHHVWERYLARGVRRLVRRVRRSLAGA